MAGIFFGPHKGPQQLREIGPMMSLYAFLEKTESRSSRPPLLCPAKKHCFDVIALLPKHHINHFISSSVIYTVSSCFQLHKLI